MELVVGVAVWKDTSSRTMYPRVLRNIVTAELAGSRGYAGAIESSLTTGQQVVEACAIRLHAISDTGIERAKAFSCKPACRCIASSTVKLTIAIFLADRLTDSEKIPGRTIVRVSYAPQSWVQPSKMPKRPQNSLSPMKSPNRPPPPTDALSMHASIFPPSLELEPHWLPTRALSSVGASPQVTLVLIWQRYDQRLEGSNVNSRFNVSLYTLAASLEDNQSLLSIVHSPFYFRKFRALDGCAIPAL
jgi:hypothetical protein